MKASIIFVIYPCVKVGHGTSLFFSDKILNNIFITYLNVFRALLGCPFHIYSTSKQFSAKIRKINRLVSDKKTKKGNPECRKGVSLLIFIHQSD